MSDTAGAETAEAPAPAGPDTEARARAQGWRPKEEFRGPTEKWVDADQFLDAADKFMPVARERNRVLEDKLTRQETELRSLKDKLAENTEVLTSFRDFASRGEQRAYERALKELTERRKVAVAHADTEAFEAADAEIIALNKEVKPTTTAKPVEERRETHPAIDPVITGWIDDNDWFNRDSEMTAYAKSQDQYLHQTKPGLSLKERLAAVKVRTMKEFPDRFENPAREGASTVATPSGGGSQRSSNKRSYENLPPEAKKACDKYVKTIPGFKREEYVANYEWD
jgi:hypothetical protein